MIFLELPDPGIERTAAREPDIFNQRFNLLSLTNNRVVKFWCLRPNACTEVVDF